MVFLLYILFFPSGTSIRYSPEKGEFLFLFAFLPPALSV